MDIINKKVSGNLELIRFFYPSFIVIDSVDKINENVKKIIYIGDISKEEELQEKCFSNNIKFIIVTKAFSEINLNNRLILANIVFSKYNRLVPKYLLDILDSLDEHVFLECIKEYWLTGKWKVKKLDNEVGFLDLIENINKSSVDLYKAYFSLNINKSTILSSLITFFMRIKQNDYRDISKYYYRKLKSFNESRLYKVSKGIERAIEFNIDNYELKILNLLYQMNSSK